ncbi:YolD-like family protein [Ectobacillus sp. sgz5001026]|uniref:YolD-like family protein n=1 Tax=Ectobacillus sp. sgz5001026 TaxID=3242473 RepID=UPI0036D35AA5
MQARDRGMKKWMAFQSLTPQYEGIRRILHNQKKKPRSILSEDKIDEINRALVEAYNKKLEIVITYYNDGFLNKYAGSIKNISTIFKHVVIITSNRAEYVVPYDDIIAANLI